MAETPEKKVKRSVRQVLDKLGAYYVMPVTGGYGVSGAPDFLVCFKGRFIGIETKAGKNTTTLLQDMNLKKLSDAGGIALVVREPDVPTLEAFLNNLMENGNHDTTKATRTTDQAKPESNRRRTRPKDGAH